MPVTSLAQKARTDSDGLKSHETFDGLCLRGSVRVSLLCKIRRKSHERGAPLGKEGRKKLLAGAISKIQGTPVGLEKELSPLDNEAVQFSRWNPLREGGAQTMQKVKDAPLLLMDLSGAALQFTDLAPG
jgi:hypothetical protein